MSTHPRLPSLLGIVSDHDDASVLHLPFDEKVANHAGTVHASAQFTLAELASGACLKREFPEYAGRVLPLLRKAEVRFRKGAAGAVSARGHLPEEEHGRFVERLEARGRATVTVQVEVSDDVGDVTCSGTYEWFVQLQD